MASSALRRSLPHRCSLRRLLPSHSPLPSSSSPSAAADATFLRSFSLQSGGEVESVEEFEKRVLGSGDKPDKPFFRNLDGVENFRGRHGGPGMGGFGDRGSMGPGMGGFGDRGNSGGMWGGGDRGNSGGIWGGDRGNSGSIWEGLSGSFDSLEDGMDEKLDDAARFFEVSDEVDDEEYEYRPDVNYRRGSSYNVRDLDITRPAAPKNPPRPQFETTTAEVLRKADFRNVRFLSNFLTEAGIIIKRSQTRISAKAQRKVAREIKTARALGLMPFTTMGRRPFIFGRSSVEEDHSEVEEGYDFVEQKEGESDEDIVGAEADLGNA